MAKVPAAWAVSLVISYPLSSFRGDAKHRTRNLEVPGSLRAPERHPHLLKSPRRFLDLFLGEEDFLGVGHDILGLPPRERRRPAFHFHHPHLADPARAGDAEHLAGLVARQIA